MSKKHSKEVSLLSEVKFLFSEISHLTYVSMCIKDENLSKQLNFSQLNLGLEAVFMERTFQFILCLLSLYNRLVITDPVS